MKKMRKIFTTKMARKRKGSDFVTKLHYDLWILIQSFLGFSMNNFSKFQILSKYTRNIADYFIPFITFDIERSWIYDKSKKYIPKMRHLILYTPSEYDMVWCLDMLENATLLRSLKLYNVIITTKIHLPNLVTLKITTKTPDFKLLESPNLIQIKFYNTPVSLSEVTKFEKLSILTIKFLNYHWYYAVEMVKNCDIFPCLTQLSLININYTHVLNMDCFPILQELNVVNCDNFLITRTIMYSTLKKVKLQFYWDDFKDLDSIFKCTSITSLTYNGTKCNNVSLLTNLTYLNLKSASLENTECIKGLSSLTFLDLSHNKLSDDLNLRNHSNLTHLNLNNNTLYQMMELPMSLTYLDVSATNIMDLHLVSTLKNLNYLDASWTFIKVIPHLPSSIAILKLSCTNIQDISNFKNLSLLHTLDITSTNVSDISVLYQLTNLKHLQIQNSLISSYDLSRFMKDRKIEIDVKVYNFRERK